MAVLTESKVRKLLKTSDFKASKCLVLEPGTIITPSARSYLTNIKIEYRKEAEAIPEVNVAEEIQVQTSKPVKNNRATQQWHLVLNQLTSKLLFDQNYLSSINENDIVAKLDFLIQTLQAYKEMDFLRNTYFEEDSLSLEVQNWNETYSQESFTPHYTNEEIVLRLYARYVDVRELEIQGTACLHDYLFIEEYHALIRSCRAMANDIWLTMVHKIEDNKERR